MSLNVRRGTTSQWSASNPILAEGEMGLDTDLGNFKIGDGSSPWANLSFGHTSQVGSLELIPTSTLTTPPTDSELSVGLTGAPLVKFPHTRIPLMPSVAIGRSAIWLPNGSVSLPLLGSDTSAPVFVGGVGASGFTGNTKFIDRLPRINVVSSGTAPAKSDIYSNVVAAYCNRGWWSQFHFSGDPSVNSNAQLLVGHAATTNISAGTAPSAQTNCVFVGYDSADSDLQIMHNDGSGTCTKVPLGSNFPKLTILSTVAYRVSFRASPTEIQWEVIRLGTSFTASGVITTNLPDAATFLYPSAHFNQGVTDTVVTLTFLGFRQRVP